MRIDLHNHTKHSDGVLSPSELYALAEKNGVDIFALTDHDSVFGCEEVFECSKKGKTKVIKGMELSTYYKGESVHIVCLFKKNIIPEEMIKFSQDILDKRKERAIKMMNLIHQEYGVKVDIEDMLSEGEIITRANMMRNIAKHNNMTYEEAGVYVSNKSRAYIPSTKMSVSDGIKLARQAGCVVIFAHPCLVKEEYVEEILAYGFDGMECIYPSKKNDEAKMRGLAKKYNLFVSAGSDCHGDSTHADIGTCTLDYEEFSIIAKKLEMEDLVK